MKLLAYLDPGSSTLIIQAVLGGAAGAAVLFKTMGSKFSRKNKSEEVAETSDTAEAAEPTTHNPTAD
ncbi:MAG: hypothetical protein M3112_06190 [Actinomycetia bacterium]|nr:hypothetical protein [Actinomycetes bacterium]